VGVLNCPVSGYLCVPHICGDEPQILPLFVARLVRSPLSGFIVHCYTGILETVVPLNSIFFIVYAVVCINNIELFNEYQLTLNRELGMANTLLLISSSYFVVRTVAAIKQGDTKRCVQWLYIALAGDSRFTLSFAEALSVTGDRFAMNGFSSRNRNHVRFYNIKGFE